MNGFICILILLCSFPAFSFNHENALMLQQQLEPESLHPLHIEGYDSVTIQYYVIEPLLNRDEKTYDWKPALATHWKIDSKNNTYTFNLRKNVTWSDGKPFTAEDVKFSFDVIFTGKFRTFHTRPYYENIEKVEILSPHKVRFHAKNSFFTNFQASADLPIVPKHIYEPKDPPFDTNRHLIGTGPYKISKWSHGKYIHLEKNHNWWGYSAKESSELYKVENVVFRFVEKPFMALEMLKKGNLDYMRLDFNMYQEASDKTENYYVYRIENKTPKSVPYMGFNFNHPFLKEKYMRDALSLLIDRKTLLEKIYHNQYQAASGPWYKESPFTPPEEKDALDPFSPDEAYKILKRHGWQDTDLDGILDKDGKKLQFSIIYGDDYPLQILTMFQFDARKAGVKIILKRMEWSVINHKLKNSDFDALYTDWGPGALEFDPRNMWHSEATYEKGGLNFMNYKNSEVDSLIDKISITADENERKKLYFETYRKIKEDRPALFFFYPRFEYYATSTRVGKPASTLTYDIGMKYWWLKTRMVKK